MLRTDRETTRTNTALAAMLLAGAALAAWPMQDARADDCLLDTNNDGDADANVDTDLGADSAGADARVACGSGAAKRFLPYRLFVLDIATLLWHK